MLCRLIAPWFVKDDSSENSTRYSTRIKKFGFLCICWSVHWQNLIRFWKSSPWRSWCSETWKGWYLLRFNTLQTLLWDIPESRLSCRVLTWGSWATANIAISLLTPVTVLRRFFFSVVRFRRWWIVGQLGKKKRVIAPCLGNVQHTNLQHHRYSCHFLHK